MAVTLLAVTTVLIAAIGSVLLRRWVRRRHRVNPHLPTLAPLSWLWSPFLPARLHRRPRTGDARGRSRQRHRLTHPRITAAMCARGRVLAEPRLAPDGSRVAFLANQATRGQLVVVPADGGAELVVTADPPVTPAAAYGGGAFDW